MSIVDRKLLLLVRWGQLSMEKQARIGSLEADSDRRRRKAISIRFARHWLEPYPIRSKWYVHLNRLLNKNTYNRNPNSRFILDAEKFLYKFIGMNIVLKRHMGYYVLQVYIPCIMLVILSWVSFFINREATSDRSCIGKYRIWINTSFVGRISTYIRLKGIMCVLSLATLSFDVRNDIPYVPYVTALDWFLIMCYLFLFASLLEFTAVHYFTKVI